MHFPTFTVVVTREANRWTATVVDGLEPGTVADREFERFADVDPGMRAILHGVTGVDPAQFYVRWRYRFGGDEQTGLVQDYQEAHRIAEEVAEWHEGVRTRLVATLNGRISQRAIADLLGLSHQRVNQLAHRPVPEAAEVVKPGRWVPY
ncbi:winged helix-turn-helix domain-containing protein [Amycolatopsis sp. NPDC005003]